MEFTVGKPFQISVSTSSSQDPKDQKTFRTLSVLNFPSLSQIVSTSCWSPIVWRDGVRKSANFISSHLLVLDFDDGRMSLTEAVERLQRADLLGIVGPTKSHQLAKDNKPAVDRFRLIVPFAEPITDEKTYRYTLERFVKAYPADKACKDAGRFYFPCQQSLVVPGKGFLPWEPPPKAVKKTKPWKYQGQRQVPPSILKKLRWGVPEGERHSEAFKLGAALATCGFSLDETVGLLSGSPLVEAGKADIERTARDGWRTGAKNLRGNSNHDLDPRR